MNGDAASSTETLSATAESAFDADILLEPVRPTLAMRAAAVWDRIEPMLDSAGDWLNPILVKETRQALKSLQFTLTFVLVLVSCWIVTIGVVAYIGPSIFYASSGTTLLAWYYAVLAFPLVVVVPYAAFRSLASEREDNTYDLLSITTLKPRQIISGKLGSSVVQMAVYFSAITPCLAFTYLLRGVDVPTIIVLVGYTFFGSLGLSMIALLLATASEQRMAQVFLSVALVAFLLLMFYVAIMACVGLAYYNVSFIGEEEFWTFTFAWATFYFTTFALMYFAAAGMITFVTENRSTPLRICMLTQQAAWIGWMAYAWIYNEYDLDVLVPLAAFAGAYWYGMGTLLTAERPAMSQRVKRSLPKSFLGRVFLSWLNPGPASGYMFTVANATFIVLLCVLGIIASEFLGRGGAGGPSGEELVHLLVVGWGYGVAYLGIGLLLIGLLRRFAHVNMVASVLIHVVLVFAGSGIPTVIQLMSVELRDVDYSLLQITNPIWTLGHLVDDGIQTYGSILVLIVPAAALCVLLLNMRGVVRELQRVRVAPPKRVVEDESVLHPSAGGGADESLGRTIKPRPVVAG